VISLLTNILGPIVSGHHQQLHVSLTAAGFLAFAFFIAYGVMSIPAGFLVERFTEKPVMCLPFSWNARFSEFCAIPGYRVARHFLLHYRCRDAVLQVAINPLLRVAGGEEHYAFNSTLAQLIFGSASFISPRIYSYLVLHLKNSSSGQNIVLLILRRLTPAELPWASIYWIFAVSALVMVAVLFFSRFPKVQHTAEERAGSLDMYRSLARQRLCGCTLQRCSLTSAANKEPPIGCRVF